MKPARQWGKAEHLTKALFEQDRIWVTSAAKVVKIESMDKEHALNTLLMLERFDDLPDIVALHESPLYLALKAHVLLSDPIDPEKPSDSLWPHQKDVSFRRIGEYNEAIRSILEDSVAQRTDSYQPTVWIDYEDIHGNVTSNRLVEPVRIEERRPGFGFKEPYLYARDVEKQEFRTFKLDRVTKVREA
jgi:hypothetical protein